MTEMSDEKLRFFPNKNQAPPGLDIDLGLGYFCVHGSLRSKMARRIKRLLRQEK